MATSGLNTTVSLHSTDTRLATAGYLTLMSTLGTLGNILVIVSIVRMKKLGRLYYILIANLSAVALITSVCLIPSHILNILNSGLVHNNTELCQFLGYLNFTLTLEVLFNTSAIALERYMVVKQTRWHVQHQHGNRTKNITVIVLLWTVPAVVSISGFPFIGYHPYMLDCFFVVSRKSFWYILFALSTPAVIAMLIIFASYFLTLKKVRDSHRKITASCVSNLNDEGVNVDGEPPSTINKNTDDNGHHHSANESEANTSIYILQQTAVDGCEHSEVASSDSNQTVHGISSKPNEELPWLQKSAAESCSWQPESSSGDLHPPQASTSRNDCNINNTHSCPDLYVLNKLSVKELQSCDHTDTREESTTTKSSVSKKATTVSKKSLLVTKKAMLLSKETVKVSEKNITKNTMSPSNKFRPFVIRKQNLNTGNNTNSVTSISSIVSETNMEKREKKPRGVTVRKYNKQMTKEISLTLHLFPVFVIFCFMYLPICLIQTIHVYYPVSPNIWLTFSTLELSFSTLSWMLYGVLNKEFRRAYSSILCCQ